MIKLTLDEAAAFDIFAIVQVKSKKIINAKYLQIDKQVEILYQELLAQVGEKKLAEVLKSDEYHRLYEANVEVFELIEVIRKTKDGLAKDADAANMKRYKAKSEIQSKFFNNRLTEIKT